MTVDHVTATESVAEFAARALENGWADTMPAIDPDLSPRARRATTKPRGTGPGNYKNGSMKADSPVSAFPVSTVAWGLDYEYQKAFDDESLRYEMPLILNIPTFTICCATLLDTGSEEQKRPARRRGAARRRGVGTAVE